ncbi:hypothetical protein GGR51DRAFT_555137 [Nemania sp. FL0031]|nr:hypothetical protein GGR51DRAFT_555137 [Nemania sp. FL0031]
MVSSHDDIESCATEVPPAAGLPDDNKVLGPDLPIDCDRLFRDRPNDDRAGYVTDPNGEPRRQHSPDIKKHLIRLINWRGQLDRFKPEFYIRPIKGTDTLPYDVLALYGGIIERSRRQYDLPNQTHQPQTLGARHDQQASREVLRDSCGWNHHVHMPLLTFVFGSNPLSQSIETRVEPVMSATVFSERPSFIRSKQNLGKSTHEDEDANSPDPSRIHGPAQGGGDNLDSLFLDLVHGRRGLADYVVVLDTMVASIATSPIALSIKMGTQHDEHACDMRPLTLILVLQILINGHEWDMFFACDRGTYIQIIGPLYLGTTETLQGIYALVACLEHVKEWIKTEFLLAIESWFFND